MNKRLLLPLAMLAGLGLLITIMSIVGGSTPKSSPVGSVRSVYNAQIAGAGLVEGGTGTIAVATPVSGVLARMYVSWGESVGKGQPLFKIDDQDLASQLPIAIANRDKAAAGLAASRRLLKLSEDPRYVLAIPKNLIIQRQSDFQTGQAELSAAIGQIRQIRAEIARRTVHAPITGRVLKINIREGEFAQAGSSTPPVLVGSDARLNIRVEVDENDSERVKSSAAAVAYFPSNPGHRVALRFERIEPFVSPKLSLSGDSVERTDTRVLEVIYSFDPAQFPAYIGQRVDVRISASDPVAKRRNRPG